MRETGLTTSQAEANLEKFGPNDVELRRRGAVKKFLAPLYSPISLMLLAAAGLSRLNGRVFDSYFILALYLVNYSLQKWQEFKADRAIKDLRNRLSFDVSTRRDDAWKFVPARELVPGDLIRLGLGSIIPADAAVVSGKNLSLNESVLTGESLPKSKKEGDKIFSGSFIATGSVEAKITATGRNTTFGKTIFSIERTAGRSILEKDILSISRFLTIVSIVAVAVLSAIFAFRGTALKEILTLDLSLVIAGIPIALPAVMTIILSIGASELAKKMVIVRRLSALQDLSNVNLLLTDKTGTLTKNQISVANVVSYQHNLSTDEVVELASLAVSHESPDAIDMAVIKRFEATRRPEPKWEVRDFVPYDSDRKRSTAVLAKGGETMVVSVGAPQVVRAFDNMSSKAVEERFEKDIELAASEGYRTLAVAVKIGDEEEKGMALAGMLFLADPLDENSKKTVEFMRENGIGVKMVTGDNALIAERIAKDLDLEGEVLGSSQTRRALDGKDRAELEKAGAFAEILPKDKYDLVKIFQDDRIVAATGDGINDLPALRAANVGIAVSGAVSALKSMADIVLLGPGLAVIRDAIVESRRIFVRLYNYSVYRISESFRLIITIFILGLLYGFYPLAPIQLILLAFLNDVPIISLAVDRVKLTARPAEIKAKERLMQSLLFGLVGTVNSLLMFLVFFNILHFDLPTIQTMFFLKLTVSGHMLIFVAHTKERWFKFLPAKTVIVATLATQAIATVIALTGFLMPTPISVGLVIFVWVWSFFWMQVSEVMKDARAAIFP